MDFECLEYFDFDCVNNCKNVPWLRLPNVKNVIGENLKLTKATTDSKISQCETISDTRPKNYLINIEGINLQRPLDYIEIN